jgi:succinate dehydrogenase / fumarate reductase, cytochrome b subunit
MLNQFYRSTVGKKVIMALTGLIFVGFVLAHMAGNLKAFAGVNPATGHYKFDEYAHFLREIAAPLVGHGTVLWIARIVLLVSLVLHVLMAIQLSALNRKAKPRAMHNPNYRSANAASRTMLYGGLVVLVFIVYHILHFTTGTLHFNSFVEGNVYANVYSGFQNPLIAGFYVLAMACLALHLYHGTWSMFQTLGVDTPAWNSGLRSVAKVVAVMVFVGFVALPISVTFGILAKPQIATLEK